MPMPEFHQLVNEAKKEIQEIDPAALKKMQQSGDDFVLIDVREPDEVSRGTIPGAVAIPRGKLELDIDKITTDKDKKLVLYCGGGSRSALAAWMLKKMGFKNVISLATGYRGWTQNQGDRDAADRRSLHHVAARSGLCLQPAQTENNHPDALWHFPDADWKAADWKAERFAKAGTWRGNAGNETGSDCFLVAIDNCCLE